MPPSLTPVSNTISGPLLTISTSPTGAGIVTVPLTGDGVELITLKLAVAVAPLISVAVSRIVSDGLPIGGFPLKVRVDGSKSSQFGSEVPSDSLAL